MHMECSSSNLLSPIPAPGVGAAHTVSERRLSVERRDATWASGGHGSAVGDIPVARVRPDVPGNSLSKARLVVWNLLWVTGLVEMTWKLGKLSIKTNSRTYVQTRPGNDVHIKKRLAEPACRRRP